MSDAFLYLGGLALAAYFFRLWLEDYRQNRQQIYRDLAAGEPISFEIMLTIRSFISITFMKLFFIFF